MVTKYHFRLPIINPHLMGCFLCKNPICGRLESRRRSCMHLHFLSATRCTFPEFANCKTFRATRLSGVLWFLLLIHILTYLLKIDFHFLGSLPTFIQSHWSQDVYFWSQSDKFKFCHSEIKPDCLESIIFAINSHLNLFTENRFPNFL